MPADRQPYVYILASSCRGTLYIGVTSDLIKRVWQHKNDLVEGFTSRYHAHLLVWFEVHATMYVAIQREKALKNWRRAWKLELVESFNPGWVIRTTVGRFRRDPELLLRSKWILTFVRMTAGGTSGNRWNP